MVKTKRKADFERELAALSAAFGERLVLRHRELVTAGAELGAAADAGARKVALRRVSALAHGLNGSAATFGYPELTVAAEALEAACLSALEDAAGKAGTEEAGRLLAALIDAVADAMERAAPAA
jgi:HPt (histidine-containing phosphotransfer) domain-containing protein